MDAAGYGNAVRGAVGALLFIAFWSFISGGVMLGGLIGFLVGVLRVLPREAWGSVFLSAGAGVVIGTAVVSLVAYLLFFRNRR